MGSLHNKAVENVENPARCPPDEDLSSCGAQETFSAAGKRWSAGRACRKDSPLRSGVRPRQDSAGRRNMQEGTPEPRNPGQLPLPR